MQEAHWPNGWHHTDAPATWKQENPEATGRVRGPRPRPWNTLENLQPRGTTMRDEPLVPFQHGICVYVHACVDRIRPGQSAQNNFATEVPDQ